MINIDLSFPTQLEVTAGSAALVSPAAPGGPRGATRLERSLQVQSLVETRSRMCPDPGPGPGLSPTPCCRETMKKLWWTVANQAPPPTTASRGKCWKVRPRTPPAGVSGPLSHFLSGRSPSDAGRRPSTPPRPPTSPQEAGHCASGGAGLSPPLWVLSRDL